MKIGIDISQLAHRGTGVEQYLGNLILELAKNDKKNEYILFFSSLRGKLPEKYRSISKGNVSIEYFKYPQSLLDLIWNRLHVFPIEWFIGDLDVFITSDWTEPPVIKARKITILYDLIVYRHPEETARKIIDVQKRKLQYVKKECKKILCISQATKKDAIKLLKIPEEMLEVIYPGVSL